jgi:capsular polysaccharide transport system permease protein
MPDSSQLSTYARLLRLTPVEGVSAFVHVREASVGNYAGTRRYRGIRSHIRLVIAFLIIVVAPACITAAYLWGLAVDRYESEARFVLRMPGRSLIGEQVAALLQSTGVTRSNDDGYIVREFLQSRDAVSLLENDANLRQALAAANRDPLWRFPNLFTSNTAEGLYDHARRLISADFDTTTGVSTLHVQAFAPKDAHRLTAALLDGAEKLTNRLNDRARQDAVALAQVEVLRMKERALEAQAAVTAFRERERLIDPNQLTLAVFEGIARLSSEAAALSVQIGELQTGSPQAPQITALRSRRAAIEAQIVIERRRLAGDAQSIAPRIAEYERLMLEREFAERALLAAMAAVETARVEAQRHQVYLERIADASLPDYPAYPWRVLWFLGVVAIGYMCFRIWRIIAADAREHANT